MDKDTTVVKRIGKDSSFEANGNKYFINTTLSTGRFEQYEILSVWVGFGMEYQIMFKNVKEAYELLNESRPMDAGVRLHNIMNGVIGKKEMKHSPVLQLCALFINREGENVHVYDKELNDKKIEDWKAEGIAQEDFFELASLLVGGYLESYNQVLATISTPKAKQRLTPNELDKLRRS